MIKKKKKKSLWFDQLHIFLFVHESEVKVLKSEQNKQIYLYWLKYMCINIVIITFWRSNSNTQGETHTHTHTFPYFPKKLKHCPGAWKKKKLTFTSQGNKSYVT